MRNDIIRIGRRVDVPEDENPAIMFTDDLLAEVDALQNDDHTADFYRRTLDRINRLLLRYGDEWLPAHEAFGLIRGISMIRDTIGNIAGAHDADND